MSVDKLQEAEEQVAQMREEAERKEQDSLREDLRRPPLGDTAGKPHKGITAALTQVRAMANMRTGALEDIHELAVSIRETGLLHPPLVRETGEEEQPYELLAGQRRFAAMQLLDEAEEPQDWRFTLIDGISTREALTMQFAENFHQSKPEPVQFARAVRLIMKEDPSLTAAEVSRIVGAPVDWTRKSLKLLDLPEAILQSVERGDLSFTTADFVRRQVARGAVSEEKAEALVHDLAAGEINTTELKFGAGYVPPPPENYAEISDRLDAARREAAKPQPREERDEDYPDVDREPSDSTPLSVRVATEPSPGSSHGPTDAELDAFILGAFLHHSAAPRTKKLLRITGEADAHEYARSLRPHERLPALRSFAREAIDAI
ncbi:ParB/RepB/Spo0J family partition protein [Solirubrobacter phytolaccae]|uniref:ParB/RepB/Spo0J family partition protein n=1 Tax=Solirubrobacter phytolaccae TaxID=1404360 RepID=A0A9X3S6G2_9ACTN|nr:ParB/RepB/Spo0J family partition protein [Solirubrobacter phytolaccae]MDA0179058.1 ParB/RepB/Spo0J family partition protein [Solirubrobacter phytolaccae]